MKVRSERALSWCLLSGMLVLFSVDGISDEVRASGREMPRLMFPVTSFASVQLGETIYIYGGHKGKPHEYDYPSTSGDFYALNIGSDASKWVEKKSDTRAQGSRMIAWEKRLFRVGGMMPRNEVSQDWDVHSLDEFKEYRFDHNEWVPMRSMPEGRSSHEVVIHEGVVYVAGGWSLQGNEDEAKWFDHLYAFDLNRPETGWRTITQPFGKRAIGAAVTGDYLIFIGGMDVDDKVSDSVGAYHVSSGQWKSLPSIPEDSAKRMKSFGAAAVSHNGRVYLSDYSGKVYTLSEDMSHWSVAGKLAHPRFFHRLECFSDGELVAIGGASRKLGQMDTLEIISLVTDSR